MASPSLRGLRVVAFVEAPAGPAADRIDALGGTPLVAPVRAEARQSLRNGIRALIGGEATVAVFGGPSTVEPVRATAARRGWIRTLRRALRDALVAARDGATAAALREHDVPVHYVPDEPAPTRLIDGVAEKVAPPDGSAQ
jgi:uroporphyrinogen-III synthase